MSIILFFLFYSLIFSYIKQNQVCFEDHDCDDGYFCNGQEICVNDYCIKGSHPCQTLINMTYQFNKLNGINNFQVFCYEKYKYCLTNYLCYSDKDCDDNIFCNGKEFCNLKTHKCESSLSICERCDYKNNKCLEEEDDDVFKILNHNNTTTTADIVFSVIVSIGLLFLLFIFLFLLVSYRVVRKKHPHIIYLV